MYYTSNSNGWVATVAQICRTLLEQTLLELGSPNNDSSSKKPCTTYRVQRRDDDDSTTTKLWLGQSLTIEWDDEKAIEKLKVAVSNWPPHRKTTQEFGAQMHNSNVVTQVSTKTSVTNLKIPILSETRFTIPRTWSSNVSLLSSFTSMVLRLGLMRRCWGWD